MHIRLDLVPAELQAHLSTLDLLRLHFCKFLQREEVKLLLDPSTPGSAGGDGSEEEEEEGGMHRKVEVVVLMSVPCTTRAGDETMTLVQPSSTATREGDTAATAAAAGVNSHPPWSQGLPIHVHSRGQRGRAALPSGG
jgi:hypothetical protein